MAESTVIQVMKELENRVRDIVKSTGVGNEKSVKLVRKTKDLKCGDIIVPAGSLKLEESEKTQMQRCMERICEEELKNTVTKVSVDKFSIFAFHLDRAWISKSVIKEIEEYSVKYGHARVNRDVTVAVNCVSARDGMPRDQRSLMDLRLQVLCCHVERLLEANGYITFSQTEFSAGFEECSDPASETSSEQNDEPTMGPQLEEQFTQRATLMAHVTDAAEHELQNCGSSVEDSVVVVGDSVSSGRDKKDVVLDLRRIIQEKHLCFGSAGFDRNLSKVLVIDNGKPTKILEDAVKLAEVLRAKRCCHCLHVVPHHRAVRQQQVQLTLAACSDQEIFQSLLIVGPVAVRQERSANGSTESPTTAKAVYESRYIQMREAAEMRNGGHCRDLSSEKKVQHLTWTSLKLDILGNTSHSPLRLDASSTDRGAESHLGAFVLYNAARLATLMSRFDQGVRDGLYPPLPAVENVDFSLLREEEDWQLVYLFLAAFPDVVRQSVESVFPEDGKNLAKIHTHKVTNFIVGFTKCLSAHYSRYHVLTGGEPHLLPLMYARLYLLKSAHQVLINSLQLTGVEALSFV